MRRVFDFGKRAVQRVNARIAILIAVVAVGGIAVWQGIAHFPRAASTPDGPTKQIATGVEPANAAGLSLVQPAVASLTDAQLPAASSDARRLLGYGQPAESQSTAIGGQIPPPTSPYAAAVGESAGGYAASGGANSGYAVAAAPSAQPAETTQSPATPPTDPSAAPVPATAIPENPYRSSPGGGGPSYGESAPPVTSSADLTPVTGSTAAISNRFSRAAESYGGPASQLPPAQPPSDPAAIATPPAAIAPPNTLPTADLNASPYAIASQAGLSPLRTNSPHPSPIPELGGSGHLAANKPGDRQLEGPQQPALLLEKVSPAEIQVGKAATFELYVRNAGRAPAQQVVVTDHVPAGTQLLDAKPAPQQGADGSLVWKLDTLQPGEEQHISLEIMPQTEGSIGSTAQVSFAAAATSRSLCTLPKLAIEQLAPPKVLIGDAISVGITVFNAGTGPATGVIVEEDVPESLEHVAGPQLEYEVGTLRPGESKQIQLSLRAKKQGLVQNLIRAHGDGNLNAQHAVQIEIVAPLLQVNVNGPKTRYLERQATYALQIANPGTAAARNVELIARLPRGMKFVTTDSQGQYDPAQHAVFWSLAELAPAQAGQVKLTTLPVEPGEQRLQIEGRAEMGLSANGEQIVHVEQSAELVHTVKDSDEVIEVGSETSYEIRVVNSGTKAATNVRIAALMPEGMSALGGEGPTREAHDATQVIFEPLNRLNPQEEVIYKVRVQATQPGEKIVRVQLSSDEWKTPVTREESTRVYQDR